ncbi:hypothetical protein ACFL59_05930 [Planctomycetota bacterium]
MKTPADLDERIRALEYHYARVYPYLLSENERKAHGLDEDLEFTLGITPPQLMLELLEEVSATEEDVFYDLGCGVGHCVLVAAMVCGRSCGIEFLPGLHETAVDAARELGYENASFTRDDLGRPDVSDGTIFFSYSTCFEAELRDHLARQVATAAPGSRIITITRPVSHPAVELVSKRQACWGKEGESADALRWVYFHRRID